MSQLRIFSVYVEYKAIFFRYVKFKVKQYDYRSSICMIEWTVNEGVGLRAVSCINKYACCSQLWRKLLYSASLQIVEGDLRVAEPSSKPQQIIQTQSGYGRGPGAWR